MGREIRRVPAGWEHPKDARGHFYPLCDKDLETALKDWAEYDDSNEEDRPNPAYYRPSWTNEERTHYQVYEDVSEGTPVSPVFATEEEVVNWLVTYQGHSERAAREFVHRGYAFSMLMTNGVIYQGIDMYDAPIRR